MFSHIYQLAIPGGIFFNEVLENFVRAVNFNSVFMSAKVYE